jgi:ribose transport system substrate-binding protein
MGAEGVELAVKIINGESVPEFIPIDGILITQDNVADFME